MKKFFALAMAAAMTLSLAACGPKDNANSSASTPGSASNPGSASSTGDQKIEKVIMGTSADYPPFEFHILDNGEDKIVGIDVSLGKQIAADMGAEFEVVHMDFDNLFTLLNQGSCDMIIAAAELNGEREKLADYSDAYYSDLPPVIVTKAGNEGNYSALTDFEGKTVGAQMGTTKATIVTDEMPGAEPMLLSSVVDLVNNLLYDKCDALVLDGAVANKYLEANKDLAAVNIDMGEAAEPYRVWVQKDDPKGLLPHINETIKKVTSDDTMTSYIEEANELSSQALEG